MKKTTFFLLGLICLLLNGVSMADAYVQIETLKDEISSTFDGTYQTDWRTVEVHAPVFVPNANQIPLVKVQRNTSVPDNTNTLEDWTFSLSKSTGIFRADHNCIARIKTIAEQYPDIESISENYYPPYDNTYFDINYSPSLDEMIEWIGTALDYLSIENEWNLKMPSHILVNTAIKQSNENIPNNYYLEFQQLIYNVPLLSHVLFYAHDVTESEIILAQQNLFANIVSEEELLIGFRRVNVSEILEDDLPLCNFETIRNSIEELIMAGYIRNIYSISLGYALYNEPGETTRKANRAGQTYYAVPVWKVECLYSENPDEEIERDSETINGARNFKEYTSLIFNAQDGCMFNFKSTQIGRADFSGYESWNEVGIQP